MKRFLFCRNQKRMIGGLLSQGDSEQFANGSIVLHHQDAGGGGLLLYCMLRCHLLLHNWGTDFLQVTRLSTKKSFSTRCQKSKSLARIWYFGGKRVLLTLVSSGLRLIIFLQQEHTRS